MENANNHQKVRDARLKVIL